MRGIRQLSVLRTLVCLFLFCLYLTYGRWASSCPTYCNVAILPVDTKDLSIFPRFSPNGFLSRCKYSITRYADQQGCKSRQKVMRLYKQWHRPITKRFIKPALLHIYREQPRSTRIDVAYPRPAFSATSRTTTFQPVLITISRFLRATHRIKIREIEIPRSMVVEALSWRSRRARVQYSTAAACGGKRPRALKLV